LYDDSIPNHLWEEVSDFPIHNQEDKMAKLQGPVRQENVISFAADISEDGQVSTITFSNLEVSVQGKNSAVVATQVATLTLPIIEHATDLHVWLTIQGYVFTQPGTRALLVAHLGDTTVLAPFAPSSDESYQHVLEATLPAGADAQTALFLLAERNDEQQGVYVNVLSLDYSLGELKSGGA
jgi:hypothetical protein